MSSLQSLRELISERLAAAAEEICRLCEGTIVQYEQELCRQRRLLDVIWKPQLQLHHIVLPQHWVTEDEDLCNQQGTFRVELENTDPPLYKEEPKEPEPSLIKEKQEGFYNSQLDLKQETDTMMEIPTYEEDESYEADLKNQQSFYVTDSKDEEGNQHEESTSTTDEETESTSPTDEKTESTSTTEEETESTSTTDSETDPQNRDKRKRRDRSHVQSVDCSPMSAGQCDSDGGKNPKKIKPGKNKQSPKEERLSSIRSGKNSRIITNQSDYMETGTDERCYIYKECGKSFCNKSQFRIHTRIHEEDKRFSCKDCEKRFGHKCHLKRHMRTHTGEKPFSCKECSKSFNQKFSLKTHMRTHTGEKPFSCKECKKSFIQTCDLRRHMITHTGEKPFSCKECKKSFSHKFSLKAHMRTHTGEKPFSCKECKKSFNQTSDLNRHMRTHTGEKPFSCKECKKSFSQSSHLNKHMRTCKTFS